MSIPRELGPAWVLGTAQQQTETDAAKQLRGYKAGDAKDTRPLHTTLCKHSKKPQPHPQINTTQKCCLRSPQQSRSPKSRDSLFVAGLSDSTPGKAMHKNSCFSLRSSGTEKIPSYESKMHC